MARNQQPQVGFPRLMQLIAETVHAMSEALAIVLENDANDINSKPVEILLKDHFRKVYPEARYHSTGNDPYLATDLYRRARGHIGGRKLPNPRLVDLVLMHFTEASEQSGERLDSEHILLPSPLFLAIDALTVPGEPHSRAYALVAARTLLSHRLSVWPRNSFIADAQYDEGDVIDEIDIVEEMGYCRTWVDYADIWSIRTDRKKKFIAQYLSARGALLCRFRKTEAMDFLRRGIFSLGWKNDTDSIYEWQFRLSQKYVRLPQPSEFMNELLGVPIAIRGTENILFNGLKPSVKAGLVAQLRGGAGTGKTSFALALAAALAPVGTQTLYFSFEEEEGDLLSKLKQLSQPRLARLSYRPADVTAWFKAYSVPSTRLSDTMSKILNPLKIEISKAGRFFEQARFQSGMLPPLPFLVVLDSISALKMDGGGENQTDTIDVTAERRQLAAFVDRCRQLGALVIIVTSDLRTAWSDLDYLVDMVLALRVEGGDNHEERPVRLLALSKSRHQIARHGTHIFHLSGESGFRLAPQLASQMDAQQNHRRLLWDKNTHCEALNIRVNPDGSHTYQEFLKIHWRSQILLRGRGSSGKAGLAMRIALSPRHNTDGFLAGQASPRVLVISFLYPQAYYDVLHGRLKLALKKEELTPRLQPHRNKGQEDFFESFPRPDVIHLTPGLLHAEDLHSKLSRQLEQGRLSGRPYTAVVIDGLHNLALQFPGAGSSSYLFPIMYGTLARLDVMTITTFTTLSITSSKFYPGSQTTGEDEEFRLKSHLPLLHTLVQASDYVFEVFRPELPISIDSVRNVQVNSGAPYLITVQSATSRDPPPSPLGWRRQELDVCDPGWGFDSPQRRLI